MGDEKLSKEDTELSSSSLCGKSRSIEERFKSPRLRSSSNALPEGRDIYIYIQYYG